MSTNSGIDIRSLVLSIERGDLTAAQPLLDALSEAGDRRYNKLFEILGQLCEEQSMEHTSDRYRSLNYWHKFRRRFRQLMWPEMFGSVNDALRVMERTLDEHQREEEAQAVGNEINSGEGDDEGHGVPGLYG